MASLYFKICENRSKENLWGSASLLKEIAQIIYCYSTTSKKLDFCSKYPHKTHPAKTSYDSAFWFKYAMKCLIAITEETVNSLETIIHQTHYIIMKSRKKRKISQSTEKW